MNDTDLAEAYGRLADAVTPPLHASELVASRVSVRRRRRASGYASLVVLLVLTAGGIAAGLTAGAPHSDGSPIDRPTKVPTSTGPVTKDGVTCRGGATPREIDLDSPGNGSFTEMLSSWSNSSEFGPGVVDRPGRQLSFLRDDLSVHSRVTWRHTRGRWFSVRYTTCPDARSWRDLDPAVVGTSARIRLTVNACFIEPVRFAGRMWEVIGDDQFGDAGGTPVIFTGVGRAWVAGDVVTYQDDGDAILTLVPVGDPWTKDFFC